MMRQIQVTATDIYIRNAICMGTSMYNKLTQHTTAFQTHVNNKHTKDSTIMNSVMTFEHENTDRTV